MRNNRGCGADPARADAAAGQRSAYQNCSHIVHSRFRSRRRGCLLQSYHNGVRAECRPHCRRERRACRGATRGLRPPRSAARAARRRHRGADRARAVRFRVSVPSWGVGTGGTRFARFPGPGEPRDVFEKLEDCEVVLKLVRVDARGLAAHPWDRPGHAGVCATFAEARGLFIDVDELEHVPGPDRASRTPTSSGASPMRTRPCGAGGRAQPRLPRSSARRSAPARTRSGSATAATSPASCTSAARSSATSTACARSTAACRTAGGCSSSTSSTSPRSIRRFSTTGARAIYCARELGPRALLARGSRASRAQHRTSR